MRVLLSALYISLSALSISALGWMGCSTEPQTCDEAVTYLSQCQKSLDSCDETQVRQLLTMDCPEISALGKAEALTEPDAPTSWNSNESPLCQVNDPEVLKIANSLQSEAGDWFNTQAFQRLLDQQTNSRAYEDNEVSLLVNGVNSYKQRFANIAGADLVLLKVYNFREDETGQQVVEALMDRLNAGGRVFIQIDIKGYYGKNVWALNNIRQGISNPVPELLQPILNHENGVVIPSNTATTLSEINPIWGKDHEKYLVTWSAGQPVKAIMGGMNVGNEWAFGGTDKPAIKEKFPGFRDTDVQVQGPVTEAIIEEFLADAQHHATRYLDRIAYLQSIADALSANPTVEAVEASQKIAAGLTELEAAVAVVRDERNRAFAPRTAGAQVRLVTNRPPGQDEGLAKAEGQYIEKLFCLMMSAAPRQTEISLSNAFFLPPDSFLSAMTGAFSRGINFRMLLNGEDAVESGFKMVAKRANCLLRTMYDDFPAAAERVQVYEWPVDPSKNVSSIHQKVWSIGRSEWDPLIIGSSNLDFHSLRRNSEGVLLIQDPTLKPAFDQMLAADFEGIAPVVPEELPGWLKCFFKQWDPLPVPDSWL